MSDPRGPFQTADSLPREPAGVTGRVAPAAPAPPSVPARPCEPDDAALIRQIAQGSEQSFRLLFERWAPPLGRFLVRATGSREAGEDLLQEAFLRILRAAPRYVPDAPAGAWLYRICANLAYSFWRKESRAPRPISGLEEPAAAASAGQPARAAAGVQPGPEAARLSRLFARDLQSALAGLPANQRMAFLLKVEQGLTYEAAGVVLGCPAGTVKSRFHYAVSALRAALRGWEGETFTGAHLTAPREADHHGL